MFPRLDVPVNETASRLSAAAIQLAKMAKTLPFSDIHVPSPGFGAMGLSFGLGSNLSLEEAEPVLLKALELGCTFWDTAVS
jgi:aryl-alcohol dehydrogenase-like predicted oxidoreductase